jgi:hypothetical protein
MSYPVRFDVEMPTGPRSRLSALVRPVLVIPHLLLVGGPALGVLGGGYRMGALGALACLAALFDWFTILVGRGPLAGLQPWKRLYLNWRAQALAYAAFLRDEYPPFGDGAYPTTLQLPPAPDRHDLLTVALRPLLLIPHAVVLCLLLIAWALTGVVSWLSLVVTGTMPASLWRFARDVITYSLRVESYALLLHDEYPPFALGDERLAPGLGGQSAQLGS